MNQDPNQKMGPKGLISQFLYRIYTRSYYLMHWRGLFSKFRRANYTAEPQGNSHKNTNIWTIFKFQCSFLISTGTL